MKKRLISFLLVLAMVTTLLPGTALAVGGSGESAAGSGFADVNAGDWFYDAVRYVSANGIFNGTGGQSFSPNGTMTRGMFVTVLGRMAGIDPADYAGETGMKDVSAKAYYAAYVKWAVKYGLTSGTGGGNFSPDEEIDRAQMAVFFLRYFEAFNVEYETGANVTTTPADLDSVPAYARDAVMKLWAQGLLNGDGVNFAPAEKASRAQVATLSQRVDKSVETWYSEPGVPSERESVDPDAAQQPEQEQKPGGSTGGGSSSGGSSGGGTTTTKYYSVQFAHGDGPTIGLPDQMSVAEGTLINTLPTPYQAGVIFLGWYYDSGLTQSAAGSDTVDRNLTLYAKTATGEEVQSIETPNYITKSDVDATKSFTFGVTGTSDKSDIQFINVTGGNIAVDFTFTDGTVTATLEAGQTYQVKLLKDEAKYKIDGAEQGEAIRYLNILTAKTEVTNATLNENVGQVSLSNISGLDADAFNGLFKMDETNTVAENTTTGSFNYSGNLNIGDTVAITSGGANLNDPTSTTGDVAYLKITGKSGDSAPYTYTYEMADVEDVLFMPDVLPIESGWDTDTTDGDVLTITAEHLATAMSNVDAASLDVGDFLGFLSSGKTYDDATSADSYGKITSYDTDENGNYIIAYTVYETVEAGEAAIESALDVYYTQNQQVTLSDDEIEKIEENIKGDVVASNYAPQAAAYLAAVLMESNELTTVPDMDAVAKNMGEIDIYGLSKGRAVQARDGQTVEVDFDTSNINVKLGTNSRLDHLQDEGFNVEIEIPFTVTINDIEIAIKASFEEEIILRQNISTKRHKIGFLKYDYSLNASFEVGNYTGIGFTADITTADGGENESMLDKLEEIMDRMEDYHEAGGVTTTGGTMDGLAEIYQGVMENANDAWIDIVEVKLFETNGNAFLHIFCWQIRGTFVVSANLAVSMGMSFEYITQKQYNFSVRVKSKTSTNETIDIITPQYDFDFYVVGTIGIRAGIRLEMYVGLFSLKLDKIGITAEAGAYARLWGYFFYHLHWEQNAGKTENSAGAMFIEIGMYLDINFIAQLLSSSKLTWNPTIYSNEWPLWSAGEQQNIYAFDKTNDTDYTLAAVKTFTLPTSTFDMKYMDLKSGEMGTVNRDSSESGTDEKYFTVSFSNSKFSYDAATNTVKVKDNANATGEKADMTITWKKAALSFTSKPIQKTIHIKWSDPENVCYVNFNSNGGSAIAQITGTAEEIVLLTIMHRPEKTGYAFGGWYMNEELSGNAVSAVTLPAAGSENKGVTLYAKWEPATDTPYTVESYTEQLNGSYTLTTDTLYGTTNAETAVTAAARTGYTAQPITQQTIAPDGSTVVKVYYDLNTYNVTFEDGISNENNITTAYKHGAAMAIPTFAREGYTFDSWDPYLPVPDKYGNYIATEGKTYTAKWTANENAIAFDSNGGSAVASATVKTDQTITEPTSTRTGYTLSGWYTDQNCTKAWDFNDKVTAPMTLYAKWVANTYTVTFNANGGTALSEAETSKSVTYDSTYGTLPTPTWVGYDFTGWYTAADGGDKVEDTTKVTTTADGQPLYAHWMPSTDTKYTVKHLQQNIPNDNYTEVTADKQTLTGTTGADTNAVAKEYTGFTPQSVTQQTIAADGSTVVEIKYDRKTYSVAWDKGEGNELTGNYTHGKAIRYGYTILMPDTPTKDPTDTHTYAFDGWYTAATGGTKVEKIGAVTDNVTYYARFTATPRSYNIIYNNMDGAENSNPTTYTCGQGFTLTDPTKTGHTFHGWYTDSAFADGTQITEISNDRYGNSTLYAKWTKNTYSVTYVLDGGTNSTHNPASYTYGDFYNLSDPTKEGHTFKGWYTDAAFTADNKISQISTTRTGNLTLYAKWEVNTYELVYMKNDGTGGNYPKESFTYGVGKTELMTPDRTGYTFGGWYETSACTGTAVTQIASDCTTQKVLLYAKWTANTYSVTFDPNGGSLPNGTANPITVPYDSTYKLPEPTHSDTKMTFLGWFTDETGGTKVSDGDTVSITEDQTLYAHWRESGTPCTSILINGETIEYYGDGSVAGYETTVSYDATNHILTLNNATISGSGLRLEETKVDGSTAYPTLNLVGTNTVTFTAQDVGDASEIYAIYLECCSAASFTGDGKLIAKVEEGVTGSVSNRAEYAIYCHQNPSGSNYTWLKINGPDIEAYAPDKNTDSLVGYYGLRSAYMSKGIIIESGSLTAKGGSYAVSATAISDYNSGIPYAAMVSENYDGTGAIKVGGNGAEKNYDPTPYKYLTTAIPQENT